MGIFVIRRLLVFVPMPHVRWLRGTPGRVWHGFRSGWEDIRRRPSVAVGVLVLDLAKYVLVAWRFQISFSLLGVEEPVWYFLVIAPAAGLAGALSFTPGGLGSCQALYDVDFAPAVIADLERKRRIAQHYGAELDNLRLATL